MQDAIAPLIGRAAQLGVEGGEPFKSPLREIAGALKSRCSRGCT
jgi:hypothetical protein